MSLERELNLRAPITVLSHRAILSVYYTTSCLKKKGDKFFRSFGLTDVQFNLMMLLYYQSGPEEGLSQAQLSKMMLVNRANITSLTDRMEKAGLVVRTAQPGDRRYNIVKLTARSKKLLAKVESLYFKQVKEIMAVLSESDQKKLAELLDKVRGNIR